MDNWRTNWGLATKSGDLLTCCFARVNENFHLFLRCEVVAICFSFIACEASWSILLCAFHSTTVALRSFFVAGAWSCCTQHLLGSRCALSMENTALKQQQDHEALDAPFFICQGLHGNLGDVKAKGTCFCLGCQRITTTIQSPPRNDSNHPQSTRK